MKKNITLVIVAINLAVLVALAVFAQHLMIVPGQVIDAHASIAKDCFSCHTPFLGSSPAKCITCHKVEEIGLLTTKGLPIDREMKNVAFHQKLIEEDCVACHSDHRGVQAFRPIGQFSHELVQSDLQEQCDSCHTRPGDALHQKITGNCSQCHSQRAWLPATFEHDQYFRFDRHHDTDCVTCHISNDYGNYTCYGCHEHSRWKIRGEHIEEGIHDYENCVDCHRSGDEHEAERIWRTKRFESANSTPFDNSRPQGEWHERRERHHDDD